MNPNYFLINALIYPLTVTFCCWGFQERFHISAANWAQTSTLLGGLTQVIGLISGSLGAIQCVKTFGMENGLLIFIGGVIAWWIVVLWALSKSRLALLLAFPVGLTASLMCWLG